MMAFQEFEDKKMRGVEEMKNGELRKLRNLVLKIDDILGKYKGVFENERKFEIVLNSFLDNCGGWEDPINRDMKKNCSKLLAKCYKKSNILEDAEKIQLTLLVDFGLIC
jgi:hypothetical protein